MYIIYTDLHIESEYQVEANLCQSDNLLSTRLDAWGHHLCFFKVGCNWFNPQASTILSCGWRTTWCFKNLDKKAKECSTQKQRIICWSSLSAWSSWPPWVLPSWQIAHEVVVPNKIHQDCINPATFRSATHVYKNLPHLRDSFHMDHFWHFNGSFFIYHLQTAAIWSIFINRHVPQNIASCWTLDQVPLNEFQPEELQQSSLHTWKHFSEMFETTFKLKVRQKVSLAQEKKRHHERTPSPNCSWCTWWLSLAHASQCIWPTTFCCRTRSSRWNFEDLNTFTESLWLLFIKLWFCRLGHWNRFLLVDTYLSEQKYYLQMQGKSIST